MRARKILITSLVISGLLSQTVNAFEITDFPWREGQATISVNFLDPGPNEPAVVQSNRQLFQNAMESAINEWTDESAFEFTIDSNNFVDPCTAANGENGVRFDNDICGIAFGSSTLAVQTATISNNERVRTAIAFRSSIDWDVFEDAGPGPNGGTIDFRRVALHELGHSIGLEHEDQITPAIMQSSYSPNINSIQTDDIAGVDALYDLDQDGVGISRDNCPEVTNPAQADLDSDGQGDLCDSDIDNDGVFNSSTRDQVFGLNNLSDAFFSITPTQEFAQAFTVGVAGQLEAIAVPVICPSGSLIVSIQTPNGQGRPSGNELATQALTNGQLEIDSDGFQRVDLPAFAVSSGDELVIALDTTGSCHWRVRGVGSYTGGEGSFSTNNGQDWFDLGQDLPFQTIVSPEIIDNCPLVENDDQADSNLDGIGDACDTDDDGVNDRNDNCVGISNPDQANLDGDEFGDECDNDIDGDGVLNGADTNPINRNICSDIDMDTCDDCASGTFNAANDGDDSDNDGLCNDFEDDDDADGVPDEVDNCPDDPNPGQEDGDGNDVGNACEAGFCLPIRAQNNGFAIICL